jgi:hypothetical protein
MAHRPDLVAAVDRAISQAEQFAAHGTADVEADVADEADSAARVAQAAAVADAANAAARAAHAAARAAHAAVDAAQEISRTAHAAAFAAAFAAFAAADVAHSAAFVRAVGQDFKRLADLTRSGEDVAIPPDADGPLGPLWPEERA